jgi:hypothetical protein
MRATIKRLEHLERTRPAAISCRTRRSGWNTGSAGLIVGQMIPVPGLGNGCRSKPSVRTSHAHPAMTNLERRLKKLEALLADSSALVPHSQAWFAH